MGIIEWLYAATVNVLMEIILFVLVDGFAKPRLRKARNDEEKKKMWLLESCGLLVVCFLVSSVHHWSFVLFLLTVVTFVYTQMLDSSTSVSSVWTYLRGHWDNHLQHEDNMKQIEKQRQQQLQLQQQTLGMAGINHNNVAGLSNLSQPSQQQGGFGVNFPFFNKNSLHYPPNATVIPGQDRPTYSMSPGSASYRDAVQQSRGFNTNNASPVIQNWGNLNKNSSSEPLQYATYGGRSQYDAGIGRSQYDSGVSSLQTSDLCERRQTVPKSLERRPLRPNVSDRILPKPVSPPPSSMKSKFMNVIGFGPTVPKPVGLVNRGQNMCFINSVVQCLARGPDLAQCLTAHAAKEIECSVAESELLSSMAELLDILTVDPAVSDFKTFEALRFRKAASVLNPSLVSRPGEKMQQQDAAEFLMWLLDTLHSILNKNSQAIQCDPSIFSNDDKFNSPRLARLKMIYGDLNSTRIKDLKDQCKMEIAAANGLENESYAEPIQRLSDLEWLTHKQNNDTVVDHLFSGQMVEAYHSTAGGNISVKLQTFSVLSVPIATPHHNSQLVMLEDCFTTFCNIENINELPAQMNEDGANPGTPIVQITNLRQRVLRSDRAKSAGLAKPDTPVSHRTVRLLQQETQPVHLPSPIHQAPTSPNPPTLGFSSPQTAALSPILTQGSSSDSSPAFRTSTPINGGAAQPPPTPRLQRRCLLRQLPECLIIQIMRYQFDQTTKTSSKLKTPVSIRLHAFDLNNVVYDTVTQRNDLTAHSGHVYELYGVCLHLGATSTAHGHYVSYCLDGTKWYRMDDETVAEVNMEYHLGTEEIRQNAYLLFYRKMATQ